MVTTNRDMLRDLILLAENPDGDGDALREYENNDSPYDDTDLERDVTKGREVHGPRTKLASEDRLSSLEHGLSEMQKSMQTLAGGMALILKSNRLLAKHMDAYDGADDAMGQGGAAPMRDDRFGGGGAGGMGAGGMGDGDADDEFLDDLDNADGGMGMAQPPMNMGQPPAFKGRRGRSRRALNKDDAASSFGEQDDDTPGNRPFDPTDTEEKDTVIQGGAGAGPGPVSKSLPRMDARTQRLIDAAVAKALEAQRREDSTVLKSTAPSPNGSSSSAEAAMGSTTNKGFYDVDPTDPKITGKSFGELNRLRADLGLFSNGVA